jgi:hypothetical protein
MPVEVGDRRGLCHEGVRRQACSYLVRMYTIRSYRLPMLSKSASGDRCSNLPTAQSLQYPEVGYPVKCITRNKRSEISYQFFPLSHLIPMPRSLQKQSSGQGNKRPCTPNPVYPRSLMLNKYAVVHSAIPATRQGRSRAH